MYAIRSYYAARTTGTSRRPGAPANATSPLPLSPSSVTDAWCGDLGARLHSVDADNCRKQSFVTGNERTAA